MYSQQLKQAKIDKHEQKTRYIATQVINDLFFNHLLTIEQAPIRKHVDLSFTADSHTYDVEVKTRNKDVKQQPFVELKHSKLKNMKKDNHNDTLIYMVIVNDKDAYFFNLSKLDWNLVDSFDWRIKKIEYLKDSEYEIQPTYKIPLSQASLKINVEEYLNKYAILSEAKKKPI